MRSVLLSFLPCSEHCLQFLLVGIPFVFLSVDTIQWLKVSYLARSVVPEMILFLSGKVPYLPNSSSTSSRRKSKNGSLLPVNYEIKCPVYSNEMLSYLSFDIVF